MLPWWWVGVTVSISGCGDHTSSPHGLVHGCQFPSEVAYRYFKGPSYLSLFPMGLEEVGHSSCSMQKSVTHPQMPQGRHSDNQEVRPSLISARCTRLFPVSIHSREHISATFSGLLKPSPTFKELQTG